MRAKFRGRTPRFGTARARLALAHQTCSPYYWWWQYLRRNADYINCCRRLGQGPLAALYEHFGDIRIVSGQTEADAFRQWWQHQDRAARLFGEPPLLRSAIQVLTSEHDAQALWAASEVVVLAVSLEADKRWLNKQWRATLKDIHTRKRGRVPVNQLGRSNALFPLHRNCVVHTLEQQLKVYDAVMANQEVATPLTRAEIGERLKLVPSAMPSPRDLGHERRTKRNVMTATVCRHFKRAQCMVARTAYVDDMGRARSQFPNYDPL